MGLQILSPYLIVLLEFSKWRKEKLSLYSLQGDHTGCDFTYIYSHLRFLESAKHICKYILIIKVLLFSGFKYTWESKPRIDVQVVLSC